jgi:Ca2+-binding EF-hand superfamily protein
MPRGASPGASATGPYTGLVEQNQLAARYAGVAFTTDFTSGTGNSDSKIFSTAAPNVIDEERRLIEKIFSIVDRDNNGTIDTAELEEMFGLFHKDTSYLKAAIGRIMSNVDRDQDGTISPSEFYDLLSQKFDADDVANNKEEVLKVFRKMCGGEPRGGEYYLDKDNLNKTAQMLGETVSSDELQEMMNMFSLDYQRQVQMQKQQKRHAKESKQSGSYQETPIPNATILTEEEFLRVMQVDLSKASSSRGRR